MTALSDIITDFAGGDEIRHLADCGYTVPKIKKELMFPLSAEKIAQIAWEHFVKTGQICLEKPEKKLVRTDYIRETGPYGRVSFRQVKTEIPITDKEYVFCDFGRLRRKDPDVFMKKSEVLSQDDKDYLLYMPWPLTPVWHIENERILRICSIFNEETFGAGETEL